MDLLPVGTPFNMLANVIYALPAVKVNMFSDATTPTFQQSNTPAFTANVAVTLTAGGASIIGGGYLRVTSGNALVTLKRD